VRFVYWRVGGLREACATGAAMTTWKASLLFTYRRAFFILAFRAFMPALTFAWRRPRRDLLSAADPLTRHFSMWTRSRHFTLLHLPSPSMCRRLSSPFSSSLLARRVLAHRVHAHAVAAARGGSCNADDVAGMTGHARGGYAASAQEDCPSTSAAGRALRICGVFGSMLRAADGRSWR